MSENKVNMDWNENDSEIFIKLADIVVPAREELIETMYSLIPARTDETFVVAELGAGDGSLAQAVLTAFPSCHYIALDRSEAMRQRLNTALAPFSPRFNVWDFELADEEWRTGFTTPLRCVLTSLVVHHLTERGKRKLFEDVVTMLEAGGAFILADIVEPISPEAKLVFASQWDQAVRLRSLAKTGNLAAFEYFDEEEWNHYTAEEPDPFDQPSSLFDQLQWLKEAGFKRVDCFWMQAGHAIFGGYV